MPNCIVGVFGEYGRFGVDLVLQFELLVIVEQPDRSAGGRQGRDDSAEQFRIKLLGGCSAFGKRRDLIDQAANLRLGFFNGLLVDRHRSQGGRQ